MLRREVERLQLEAALLAVARHVMALPEAQRRAVLLECLQLAVLRAVEPVCSGPGAEVVKLAGPKLVADQKDVAKTVLRLAARLEKCLGGRRDPRQVHSVRSSAGGSRSGSAPVCCA